MIYQYYPQYNAKSIKALDEFVFRCYILDMDNSSQSLARQTLWIIHRIPYLEKNKVYTFNNIKLYPSEIHLMLLIDEIQANNATEMAQRLGVTKGAISQTISRLVKKGLVEKSKDPFNKNEITLIFTTSGQEALNKYRALRAFLQSHFDDYFSTLSEEERQTIHHFLSRLEATLSGEH